MNIQFWKVGFSSKNASSNKNITQNHAGMASNHFVMGKEVE